MPLLTLTTNCPIPQEQPLLKKLSSQAAQLLGKPESYVMALVQADQPILMGGSDAPCAFLQLKSLGLPENATPDLSAALCDTISEELGIPGNRIYIEFSNPDRHMWGWDRRTFG